MAALTNRKNSKEDTNLATARRGLRLAYSEQMEPNQTFEAARAARYEKAGSSPLKLRLVNGKEQVGHYELTQIFYNDTHLDSILIKMYHNGYNTISDLDGEKLSDIFYGTDAKLHEQRYIIESLKTRVAKVILSL